MQVTQHMQRDVEGLSEVVIMLCPRHNALSLWYMGTHGGTRVVL